MNKLKEKIFKNHLTNDFLCVIIYTEVKEKDFTKMKGIDNLWF